MQRPVEMRWLDAEGNDPGGAWRLLSARARAVLAGHVYVFPDKGGEGEGEADAPPVVTIMAARTGEEHDDRRMVLGVWSARRGMYDGPWPPEDYDAGGWETGLMDAEIQALIREQVRLDAAAETEEGAV